MNEKKLKKEIRLWAGKVYERLLNKALRDLDEDFNKWRTQEINPFELSDQIHKFHNGISRQLYVLAGHTHGLAILMQAIEDGEIRPDELSSELRDYLRPKIEAWSHQLDSA